jgi:LL-diaminopimelate aminotransferase
MAPLEKSARLRSLPRYLFAELERKRHEAESAGKEVFDLSIGDPDLPTPGFILDRLAVHARDPRHHRYPTSAGNREARAEIARWFAERFGVEVNPVREVAMLLGSKEGIGHFPLAVLDPGDEALVPDPGYPVYTAGTVFAAAKPVRFPIREEAGFVPEIRELDKLVTPRTRVAFVNYPNNPTGAVAPGAFYEELVAWAVRRDILLVSDAAYSELYYGEAPQSIFSVPGARDRAIEFHSFSKTFNMTGWRIGFAVGTPALIEALVQFKANVDSGAPQAIQLAAAEGLRSLGVHGPALRGVYRERRDLALDTLRRLGCPMRTPGGAFYLWGRVPEGQTSMEFVTRVFDKTGVLLTPGTGFGTEGEGYFRIALTSSADSLRRALQKLETLAPWKAPHASPSPISR